MFWGLNVYGSDAFTIINTLDDQPSKIMILHNVYSKSHSICRTNDLTRLIFIYNVYVKTLSILLIGDPLGQTTLDSRLRYDSYSPHHQLTMTASGHHLRSGGDSGTVLGHQNINGSPCRSPGGVDNNFTKIDSHNR